MTERDPRSRTLISAVRLRVVAVVCTALALISLAAVLGISVLVDMYTKRQLDLASRILTYSVVAQQDNGRLDPAAFTAALPRNTTVVFLNVDGDPMLPHAAGPQTDAEIHRLLDEAGSGGGIVDSTLNGHPVKARLLRFGAAVDIAPPQAGAGTTTASALIAIGERSATKLTKVMIVVCIVVSILMMGAAAAAATIVVRRTMAPLRRLAEHVDALDDRPAAGALAHAPAGSYRESATLRDAIVGLIDRRARSEAELREFTANVSHELRTPLTKIQGWSELYFQRRPTTAQTERAMRSIVEECDRMRRMVDQLTLLARAEAPLPAPAEPVDICALCRVVVEDVTVIAPDRTIEATIPGTAVFVDGHRDRLAQALRNLLGNSLIHAGPEAHLAVHISTAPGLARIDVCDDGAGISDEHREHVFERFYRASPSGGSGLGLSIVRTIAESHGGRTELQSGAGGGTTVSLVLPRCHPQPRSTD